MLPIRPAYFTKLTVHQAPTPWWLSLPQSKTTHPYFPNSLTLLCMCLLYDTSVGERYIAIIVLEQKLTQQLTCAACKRDRSITHSLQRKTSFFAATSLISHGPVVVSYFLQVTYSRLREPRKTKWLKTTIYLGSILRSGFQFFSVFSPKFRYFPIIRKHQEIPKFRENTEKKN